MRNKEHNHNREEQEMKTTTEKREELRGCFRAIWNLYKNGLVTKQELDEVWGELSKEDADLREAYEILKRAHGIN